MYCGSSHNIYNCGDYLKLSVNDRIKQANIKRFCINCLRKNYATKDCRASNCRVCNKKHHTLLHIPNSNKQSNKNTVPTVLDNLPDNTENSTDSSNELLSASSIINSHASSSFDNVLLATVTAKVYDYSGNLHPCRILLYSASQSNFVNTVVFGISKNESNIKYKTDINIISNHNAFKLDLSCLVLKQITSFLPSVSFKGDNIQIPPNLR